MSICACGQPLWAPASIDRGYCEHCRIFGGMKYGGIAFHRLYAGARPFPYRPPPGYPAAEADLRWKRRNDE